MRLPGEHRFPDVRALVDALAGEVRAELADALRERGHGSLVVSGGRTPLPLFKQLAREPLDWSKISVTLADERWVPTSDAQSNEYWVRRCLLQGAAGSAQWLGLKNAAATPADGSAWAWRSLTRIPRPFDLVLLGMGEDGHTASLFPHAPGIAAALDTAAAPGCVAMAAPQAPVARLSLNLSALLAARRIVLHFQGEAKWRVYQQARQPGPVSALPVRALLKQRLTPVEVFWSPEASV